jgi:type I restriction enzyme M protein
MRKKLIQLDWLECIIGIGKNLFYNSPMEACIVICNIGKSKERKGKILFINAKDEITRKNAQSYLEDCHIQRIADTYNNFASEDRFSAVATIEEISSDKNNYSLGISKYVTGAIDPPASKEELDLAITQWLGGSSSIHDAYKHLNEMISGGEQDVES